MSELLKLIMKNMIGVKLNDSIKWQDTAAYVDSGASGMERVLDFRVPGIHATRTSIRRL